MKGVPKAAIAALVLGLILAAPAAAAPTLGVAWSTSVLATTATLHGEANPNGIATAARFEYLTEVAYQANLSGGKEAFAGATKAPAQAKQIGSGTEAVHFSTALSLLTPNTTYRYRVSASQGAETVLGQALFFTTEQVGVTFTLPEGRGWEMVSPPEKNGGAVQGPGENFGGGLLQAAAGSPAFTYSSSSSFGEDAQGAPTASQYLAQRGGGGWLSQNVSAAQSSAAEPPPQGGVPYRAFSADLSLALLKSGGDCLTATTGCADPSAPPAGSGGMAGFQNYYLRDNATGKFQALLTAADAPALTLSAEAFSLSLAGATADLNHVALSTCAALTAGAIEAPQGEGCDPAAQNLYMWDGGSLRVLNVLPGESESTPGALLGAQVGAVLADGARAYFSQGTGGPLYLSEAGGETKLLPESGGGGAAFQTASADGQVAFFTRAGTLYRYDAQGKASEALAAEVQGVLGASADGSRLYYETPAGLFTWHGGEVSKVAAKANASNWPPASGTARLSADGTKLLFSSTASLTGYDNLNAQTGDPDTELFLYDALAKETTCVSCNPTNERPAGSSSLPGAIANGKGALATQLYKPRSLSADAKRVFFDSRDALALQDTNNRQDVYQWLAQGSGGCTRQGGCIGLISSGRDGADSSFLDASADGSDAYFLTAASLVPTDPDAYDAYDARVGGGFPIPPAPIPCEGDACQSLPPQPEDPTPGTLVGGGGNPPLRFVKEKKKKRHKKGHRKKHHGKGNKGHGQSRRAGKR